MNKLTVNRKFFYILFFILCFSSFSYAQGTGIKIASEAEIKENLQLVPCKNEERLAAVKKLFQTLSAADSDITVEKSKDLQNLVVTKKGKSDETIVVGAHYDKVKDGCGAIDNWTGIVIIANLYRTLKNVSTDKTILFVAFDREESGLLGSEAMAKAISKDKRANFCAMVNLDSFGFSYPQILDNTSSPRLSDLAKELMKELKLPFLHASLAGTADADSTSFIKKDIPAITFHGLSNDWQKFLHSSNDKLENVNTSSVFVGYQFLLRYLAKVDSSGCGAFRK
jgi:Zn-dependent M28 family amino/carboxypeptidase